MTDYYEKDGHLYESNSWGSDRDMGEIRHSVTGDYVQDGLNQVSVDRNLGGDLEIITERDYLSGDESGAHIERNPFEEHGQRSTEFNRSIYGESNAGGGSRSPSRTSNYETTYPSGSNSSYSSSGSRDDSGEKKGGGLLKTAVKIGIAALVIGAIVNKNK
jgi:hypothetical protein